MQKPDADTQRTLDTALADASRSGDVAAIRKALAAGANIEADTGRAIRLAALGGHLEAVQALLAAGADPNARNGRPLVWAINSQHLLVAKCLLDAGANPDIGRQEPLRCAADGRDAEAVAILLNAGASLKGIAGNQWADLGSIITAARKSKNDQSRFVLRVALIRAGETACLQAARSGQDLVFLVREGLAGAEAALQHNATPAQRRTLLEMA